jgi:hypothetical protein
LQANEVKEKAMTTVVFVHGTGVRVSADKDRFWATFGLVSSKLHKHVERPDLNVVPCFWGNELGAKLQAEGASIPEYDTARGFEAVEDEDYEISLWRLLYQDPLYELRVLSLRTDQKMNFTLRSPSLMSQLDHELRNFVVTHTLRVKLEETGLIDVFRDAQQLIIHSPVYYDIVQSESPTLDEYRAAIARAIVAQAILLSEERQRLVTLTLDATLRNEIITLLIAVLGDAGRSIGGVVRKLVIANPLTLYLRRWRGKKIDETHPFPGDILLYQARGEPIRQHIQKCIEQAAKDDPNIILLAHSLGGIACVDLLVLQESVRNHVKLLVTVGSQTPFLYEIGALYSLPFGEKLPVNFPKWLNIYDLNDFLSYIGDKDRLFRGQAQIRDVCVDSREPFPYAHSAYWKNDATWKAIAAEIL